MIGKLSRLPLSEVWKHEALDFTPWLEENIDVLNDALDLSLDIVSREQSAGNFSVDLVAKDNGGNIVIIENQLGRSDHDHLGKLITYITALEAKVGIWIVGEPRAEHVTAVGWLNESASAAFYLVKVEAVKIGESPPAALFTKILGPSEEAKKAGETKKNLTERHLALHRFWTALLEKAKQKTKLHAGISPGYDNWVATGAGLPNGIHLNYIVRQHDAHVELYIDADQDTGEGNKAIYEQLLSKKQEIEHEFGGVLEWEALEGKRACRIKKSIPVVGWQDEDKWAKAHEAMIDAMIKLDRALRPHLNQIHS